MPVVRLGIHGLPNLTNHMLPGGLYALIAGTPPARFPVLADSLGHAINDGLTCSIVIPSNPELFVERIESFSQFDLPALIHAGRVNVFEMQDEIPKKMFRFGADSFVRELEQFGVPENSYIVFDQADELLALHDVTLALDQIDVLRKWFERKNITVLLVFSRNTAAHAATINALMDNLTGLTRLGADKNGLDLTFDYWQSPEGTIAGRHFHLLRTDSGFYEASSKAAPAAHAPGGWSTHIEPPPAEGAQHYFYMDPDLSSLAQQLPGIWQRVDTLVGMMHATRNKTASIIILSFYRDTRLRHLAEAVHTLRMSLGPYVRIVVQEKGASLRYQNEALLLRLGVSLVVHRDVAASRLPLLLESLHGQVFSRDVNINFEAALASVLPTRLKGYLVPPRFVKEVNVVMERAETLNIPYALVAGRPKSGVIVSDIIANSALSRSGDLITADNEQCFIFLNACPQPVLLATLQRILGAAAEDILEEIRFLVSSDDIEPELAALMRAVEKSELPDYTALAPAMRQHEEPQAPEETGSADSHILPPAIDTYTNTKKAAAVAPLPAKEAMATAVPAPARQVPDPGPDAQPEAQAQGTPRFAYEAHSNANAFGKREVPRAVRRMAPGGSTKQQNEEILSSTEI